MNCSAIQANNHLSILLRQIYLIPVGCTFPFNGSIANQHYLFDNVLDILMNHALTAGTNAATIPNITAKPAR